MTAPACTVCAFDAPPGATLCRGCWAALAAALAQVPALAAELDTARARQAAARPRGGPRAAEAPLPWDERASRAHARLHAVLAGWTRVLVEDHPHLPPPPPQAAAPALAAWLAARARQLRAHPAADDVHHEITTAVDHAWAAVDRPPDRRYLGPCPTPGCGADLYALPTTATATCPACRATTDVAARTAALLASARDLLLTGPETARALTALGDRVTADRLRQWHARGRLASPAADPAGRRLWRVGDVLDLLADDARRRLRAGS